MTHIPRQRLRPGIGGISQRPIDPAEAYRAENMVLQRDGVWKPRRNFATPSTPATQVTHVSNLKFDHLVLVQNGSLRVWQEAGWVATIDTGWPQGSTGSNAGWLQYTRAGLGATGPRQPVWCAPKKSRFNTNTASMYYISASSPSTGGILTGGRATTWMENHGNHTIGGQSNSIFFSDSADVASWGLNDIDLPWRIGEMRAIISLDDIQTMLFGTFGIGMMAGNTLGNFSVGVMLNDVVLPYGGSTVVRCGNRVMVLGSGPSVYEVTQAGLRRISLPIETSRVSGGLIGEISDRDITTFNAWYDPTENWYCVSTSSSPAMTWIYDLARDRWISQIPYHLVGVGFIIGPGQTAFRKYYAVNGTLGYQHDYGTPAQFDDLGSGTAFTCAIETAPEFQQAAEAEKQATAGYLDATGSWTVTLRHRNNPDAVWTDVTVGTYSGPSWVYLPSTVYRERVLRFTAPAAADVRFRGFELDERITGVPA